MNVSLRALRYVVATADSGNLTEAARKLNVSQPSISSAIAQVEDELGVQIFIRHHARGVTLTSAGARIIGEARGLLNHARDFTQSAKDLGSELRGEISVGCLWTIASHLMPSILSGFAESHGGVVVSLEEGDQQNILDSLAAGRTELALSYRFAIPDEVAGEKLTAFPPYAVLPAGHRLAGRKDVELAELAEDEFILLDMPYSRDYFLNLFRAQGLEPKVAFRARTQELARGLVGHGRGYTITNLVAKSMDTYDGGRVAAIPISGDPEPVELMILALKRQSQRPAVDAFVAHLREMFAPDIPVRKKAASRR
ncbi:transcriptional regulator [Terrihabitans soli]|uniref:Transcriptional regulator n=1 Tax=Terrihabitans soli TaxID=708113 RepID=A0A6S6QMQ4_9HYPH|nr:LysR family transcriptional regulator [Terrihabitans soli]BCJ90656.1 transcriptional regulator [Terrihabitans soli]